MTKRKRVLYFMPDNPFWSHAGNLTRAKQLLSYFERNIKKLEVEFLSCLFWNPEAIKKFKTTYPHIELTITNTDSDKRDRIKYLITDKIPRLIHQVMHKPQISLLTPIIAKRIKSLMQDKHYDIIVISYSTWGSLIRELNPLNAYKIIDTHDFMTLQRMKEKSDFDIGGAFREEMDILSLYDEIWTYSVEERYIYEQFTNRKVTLLPVSTNSDRLKSPSNEPIAILYVASDNIHNTESMKWFVNSVLPLIPEYKIHLVGKICQNIPDHPQLIKHGVVEDIGMFYANAKITICPMLSGTGIKIKVLESLYHGLPVITNRRGVDGLVNKINNGCLVADNEVQFADGIKRLMEDTRFYSKQKEYAEVFYHSFYTFEKESMILDELFLS
ncbi:glycosyltransferase [Sphingobacterium multivorum]|uniref:glycosyltransferase n=1 Tax=Sphingobacterium multivorum TaxID=28454 RepID=UPI0030159812